MQRISSRLLRPLSSSTIFTNTSKRSFTHHSLSQCLSKPQLGKQPSPTIPGQFLKWGLLGFVGTFRFTTGFSPLEPKPLDSIMDIECAKHKSPEELASIWDDMMQIPHILFTGLEDYKARGTQAAPYFTVTFYTDFVESKDLVLIQGAVVFPRKLTDEEAE